MPTANNSLILREVLGQKLSITQMDGDLLYLSTTLSASRGDGIIQVTGSSFDASNTNITGSRLSLINITEIPDTHVLTYNTTTKQVNYTASSAIGGGGSGTPSAPVNSVQFNNAGAFGGNANFTFTNNSTASLTGSLLVSGGLEISGSTKLFGLTNPTATNVLTYNTSTGQVFYTASSAIGGGGSGVPGGANTTIQFNDAGAFSGSGNFTFIKGSNLVTLTGSLTVSGSNTTTEIKFQNLQENLVPTSSVMIDEATGKLSYINFWYSQSIGGAGATSIQVNHNLGTILVHVTVMSGSAPYDTVYPTVQRTNANTVTLIFSQPPATNEYIAYISR